MSALLELALTNALAAIPLALLAWLIGWWTKRPAVRHALWLLVLLKLVIPAPFRLPAAVELPFPAPFSATIANESRRPTPDFADEAFAGVILDASPATGEPVEVSPAIVVPSADEIVPVASPQVLARWGLGLWIAGILIWFARQLVRAVRFRFIALRQAIPSPHLQQQIHELAPQMGLQFVPRVWLTQTVMSPMLWGCGGRAKLLFPSDLASRLDDDACATLLAHELAHYVRGDHYVRVLELLATGLFWWHPVLLWARLQIEEAEEECSDALVVEQFPENPRKYAEALLDTIDYLCETAHALPPVACGLGHSYFLRRRLTKIMTPAQTPSRSTRRWPLWIVGAALLLWQPIVFGSSAAREPLISLNSVPAASESGGDWDSELPAASRLQKRPLSPDAETSPASQPAPARPRRVAHLQKIWATAASPNGRFVIRATVSRRLILTDLEADGEHDLSRERIAAVAFGPDGAWFAAAGHDGRITLWDSATGALREVLVTQASGWRTIAVSPEGDRIAAGNPEGTVLVIELAAGGGVRALPSQTAAVNCIRFAPNGRSLALALGDWSSNRNGRVSVLDVESGRPSATLACGSAPGAVTFASNHELIVGLWSGRTLFWNLSRRDVIGTAQPDKGIVAAAAFSQDNSLLREVAFQIERPAGGADARPPIIPDWLAPAASPRSPSLPVLP
jgi:beta-lactamase regulating signal transducer with metallopeptidase domain/WD40 repeat protein